MNPDFSDRTYIAEVLRTSADPMRAVKSILTAVEPPITEVAISEDKNDSVTIFHGFLSSERGFHRTVRTSTLANGERVELPRQTSKRGKRLFLYDVLIAQRERHIVVAVPFHQLAEVFFFDVDRLLSGTRTVYERLDITRLVISLGVSGVTQIPLSDDETLLSINRCHLAYADRDVTSGGLKQVQITGTNVGISREYQSLISPVLSATSTGSKVTPVVLGFALSSKGVKKSSAVTDRHGNFKLWVAPGLRRLTRLFGLLDAIETMAGVTSTTGNVPILQSKNIRDAED